MSSNQPQTQKPPSSLPPDIPPEARAFLEEMGYMDPDRLRVGEMVPDLALAPLGGGDLVTIGRDSSRPTVLIFGSYT